LLQYCMNKLSTNGKQSF